MKSPAARDRGHSTADAVSYFKAPKPPVDGRPTPEPHQHSALIAHIARQERALAEQAGGLKELRARLCRREEELREARAVLVLVLMSRVYHLMRLLGRWGWLEHRIRRALR